MTNPTRGGKRDNAGRPSTWHTTGETKQIKVPVAIADKVMAAARRIDLDEYNAEYGNLKPINHEQLIREISSIIKMIDRKEDGYTKRNATVLIDSLMTIFDKSRQ